jgi:hypothetical protein
MQSVAPCQEVVIKNPKNVNDYMVPIRHTTYEPELTVGSGIRCISFDQFDGGTDLGYNRMNFRWGNVGTFQISPGSHMWQVANKYYKDDKPIPMTMCFGVPPACTLMAGAGFDYAVLPMGCDEIGIAGAVQGTPIRMVKCRTVDAYTLADAEIVLEGYIHPRDRRYETKESEDAVERRVGNRLRVANCRQLLGILHPPHPLNETVNSDEFGFERLGEVRVGLERQPCTFESHASDLKLGASGRKHFSEGPGVDHALHVGNLSPRLLDVTPVGEEPAALDVRRAVSAGLR